MRKANLNVKSTSAFGAKDLVSKGLAIGLLFGAAGLAQAGPVVAGSEYMDSSCNDGAQAARHGNSRGGCAVLVNEMFSEGATGNGRGQSSYIVPFSAGPSAGPGAAPASVAAVPAAAPAPAIDLKPSVVRSVTGTDLGDSVAPANSQSVAQTPGAGSGVLAALEELPVESAAPFASVPEPGTGALLLGGLLALIGIRRRRVR